MEKKVSQQKSAYSFCLVFQNLNLYFWKLVFPNLWISFATASMHILKLLFTSKKCSKTFPIWRGGILRGEMYNLYKKKLNVVIKIFSPFLFNIYFGIDWFSQNCKQVDVKFEESKQLSMFVTVIKLKGISVQKIFNLDFGIDNVRTLFYHQLTCLQADIDTKNHPPNNCSWTSFFLKRKIF